MFNYDEKPYVANEKDKFFHSVVSDELNHMLFNLDDSDFTEANLLGADGKKNSTNWF